MNISQYHFHLYFQNDQIDLANSIIDKLRTNQHVEIGRVWNRPIGPHPIGSCQITVSANFFQQTIRWFLENRAGLSVFIHPLTGNDLKDHTDYAMWIGESYKINTGLFSKPAN